MKRIFKALPVFSLAALFAAALVSCNNLQDSSGGTSQTNPQPAAQQSKWAGVQTLSGTIEKQKGIFPAEFCSANEIAASSAGALDGVSKSIFPEAFSDFVLSNSLHYYITAKVHEGTETVDTGTVESDGSAYSIELPYASGGTDWDVTICAQKDSKTVLKKTETIRADANTLDPTPFQLEYSTDSTDGTGSIDLTVTCDPSSGVACAVATREGSSAVNKQTPNATTGKMTFTFSGLAPGSYKVSIIFYSDTAATQAVYAIQEAANVYANLSTSALVGSAPYIASGKINVTSECISALGSVADGGIWLGGTGLGNGKAAADSNSGTAFAPVATLRRAFEIANQLAAADSEKTYTINVQGDVVIGSGDDGDAVLNADTKVLVKGTVTTVANAWSVDGHDNEYYIVSNSSDATFEYLAFYHTGGITAAAGSLTMNNCLVSDGYSEEDDTGGGITVNSGATFTSTEGLSIENCVNNAKGGGGVLCSGTLKLTGTKIYGCDAQKTSSAKGNGGGIYIEGENAKVTLDSCLIGEVTDTDVAATSTSKSNSAANYGGGIYIASAKNVELSNTTVSYNCAASGGGAYVANNALVLKKSSIEKNAAIGKSSASGLGGGIYLDNGTISFSGDSSTIACNQAVGNYSGGGGLYVSSSSGQSAALGGEYYKNSCVTSAGAVAGSGGAIYNACSSRLTIDDDVIIGASGKGNSANYGGGIYNGSDLLIGGATISGNTAADSGGGVYNTADHSVTFIAGTISANSALKGGGIYNAGNVFVIGTAVIGGSTAADGNKAKGTNCFGGGIFNYTSGFVYLGYRTADTPFEWTGSISANSSENNAGGIHNVGTVFMAYGTIGGATAAFANTAVNNGGALYCSGTCTFQIGGGASVPPAADGSNDIYLNAAGNKITLMSALTTATPVGLVTLNTNVSETSITNDNAKAITSADVTGSDFSDSVNKFKIKQNRSFQLYWNVSGQNGIINKDAEFVPVEGKSYTTTGISGSSVFINGRSLTIPKMLVCVHELTQKDFQEYCQYAHSGKKPIATWGVGDNYPAYYTCWYDMVVYCNLRSMAEGLTPVYSLSGETDPRKWTGIVGSGSAGYCGPASNNSTWDTIEFETSANGWRMPTEAEWEFIARGGTKSNGYKYSGSNNIGDVSWYSESKPQLVMQKNVANELGIYDMSGNVWEVCWDWGGSGPYPDFVIPAITTSTPATGAATGEKRMLRGGSFNYGASASEVANRSTINSPSERWENSGGRILRNIE